MCASVAGNGLARRGLALGVLLCAVWAMTGAPAAERPSRRVNVETDRKRELHEPAQRDVLEGYEVGDIVVVAGYRGTSDESRETIVCCGHRGYLHWPVEKGTVPRNTLIRGRFEVVARNGAKLLSLRGTLNSLDCTELIRQAESDYRALLPEIQRKSATPGSKLVLREKPSWFGVLTPPEGWAPIYVTTGQSDKMYACAIAFQYELGRPGQKPFWLASCWAAQWFKGE